MNFEQRVRSIVDERYDNLLEVFQSAEDRTGDLLPYLQKLVRALPLIEDIKTEVNSIEKKLQNKPEDKEEEEKKQKREPDRNQPTLEDQREVNKFIDWLKSLLPEPELDLLTLPAPEGMLSLPGPGSDSPNFDIDFDLQSLLLRLLKGFKEFDDKVNQKMVEILSNKKIDNLTNELQWVSSKLILIEDRIVSEIGDAKDELKRSTDAIQETLEQCCSAQSSKLDAISRKIDNLNPDRQANQDLAIIQQGKSIRNEVFSLRGLL